MKKILILIWCFYITATSFAQASLKKPEKVVFDQTRERYLVTNYGTGELIAIDMSGKLSVFTTGLKECLGMTLFKDNAYVTCLNSIKEVDLKTGKITNSIILPVDTWMDGITNDNSGNLYAIEVGGKKIYRVSSSLKDYKLILNSGLGEYPQDLAFDKKNNRLLVVCYNNNGSIYSLDLNNYSLKTIPNTNVGRFDGIDIDSHNNVFVSSHIGGKIHLWKDNFREKVGVISSGYNQPAGICFNEKDSTLAIPSFGGNKVDFIDVREHLTSVISSINEESSSELQVKIYPIPTKDQINIETSDENINAVELISLNGVIVKNFSLSNASTNTICTSNFPKGTYILKFKSNNATSSNYKRIVIL